MNKNSVFLLRAGIAFSLFYAAIASFITPLNWIGYFPPFLKDYIPQEIVLSVFSIYEMLLGAWILSGWKTFYAALLAASTMLGIIIFNIAIFDVVFRDVTILFASLALALDDNKKTKP